jgi:hypothetical protein
MNIMPSANSAPTYGHKNGYGTIQYFEKSYKMDLDDLFKIINYQHSFKFQNPNDDYPSYNSSYKPFSYLDFIFKISPEESTYVFENGDKYDLRKGNVEILHKYHSTVCEKYNVLEYFKGHCNPRGRDANVYKNPIWKIQEKDKEYLIMYCEKDTLVKLCKDSYQKILDYEANIGGTKLTWYMCVNGYIATCEGIDRKSYFMHQIIMNCYGNGRGTANISVDHIDRNPLNNSFENLRIANREEQQQNQKGVLQGTKRERQSNARPLPEGITQDMLRKYIVYYYNIYDKVNNKSREYFRVEGHPKMKPKSWETSKSNAISILDKLAAANKVVDDLDQDIFPEEEDRNLPRYVSLITFREKPHLVFEKRVDNKRLNLKMVLPAEYNLHDQLMKFDDKISKKYPDEHIFAQENW